MGALRASLGDEMRGVFEDRAARAERHQGAFGILDELCEARPCASDTEEIDQRGLAVGGILAGGLAECGGVAFDVEQIVGDLERLADHLAVAVHGVALVAALARAAGLGGMVGGQMLDLAAEGRFDGGKAVNLDAAQVKLLQTMKTGALLRFGCLAGAILGEATAQQRDALDRYGTLLGEAFQIADDLLDVEGDAATVGKATGKDAAAGKGTFVTALGLEGAKARLKTLVAEAEEALSTFGRDGEVLKMAARFVAERKA